MPIHFTRSLSALAFLSLFLMGCGRGTTAEDRARLMKDGDRLFHQYACITCHSLDGKEVYGPALNNLYMKKVEVVRGGDTLTLVADRSYLRRAIADPRYEEVRGYESKDMPEVHISGEEIDLLVDYLILRDTAAAAPGDRP